MMQADMRLAAMRQVSRPQGKILGQEIYFQKAGFGACDSVLNLL
jgi:hypothetical protein